MHRIKDAAKLLGVSKQSVYRKLDCTEMTGHVHDTDKGKCVDDEGLEILRGLLPFSVDSPGTVQEQPRNSPGITREQPQNWRGQFRNNSGIVQEQSREEPGTIQEQSRNRYGLTNGQALDAYIKSLEEQVDYLKNIIDKKDIQITEKDKQISEKDRQLLDLTAAVRMREEQAKAQLMIEASSQVPQEITDIPRATTRRGLFSRWFNGNGN